MPSRRDLAAVEDAFSGIIDEVLAAVRPNLLPWSDELHRLHAATRVLGWGARRTANRPPASQQPPLADPELLWVYCGREEPKISDSLRRRFIEAGLAVERDRSEPWVGMQPGVWSVYMAALADVMAQRNAMSPVTDDPRMHRAMGAVDNLASLLTGVAPPPPPTTSSATTVSGAGPPRPAPGSTTTPPSAAGPPGRHSTATTPTSPTPSNAPSGRGAGTPSTGERTGRTGTTNGSWPAWCAAGKRSSPSSTSSPTSASAPTPPTPPTPTTAKPHSPPAHFPPRWLTPPPTSTPSATSSTGGSSSSRRRLQLIRELLSRGPMNRPE